MEKDKIELKAVMATAEVADYLSALAKGFRAGRIVVEKDGERLELCPDAMTKAEVEVEARLKKDKAKFSLELSWRLPLAEGEAAAALKISSDPPKAAKPEETKAEDKKSAPPATKTANAAAAPAAAPKSDVKPAAPAVNEPGGKAAVAAASQPKPKQ